MLLKATLKDKNEVEQEDNGWESVEEDYPHIQLDDLKSIEEQLAGMKIKDENEDDDDYEEEEHKQ